MNLLYCGNKNIENGLIISILSFLKNVDEEINIYVLTIDYEEEERKIEGVSDSIIEYLDSRVKEENCNNFVKKLDITESFKKDLPKVNMNTRFTPCCMLRLFADIISELPDQILYVDNDVVCRKNCKEFYYQDIENYEIVGVLDYYGRWFFKKEKFKFDYINSGVLLLNLVKIRETGLFENARKLCKSKRMFMPDQSAINKLATSKKIEHRRYNEQRRLRKDTVLQHFTTSFRLFPWLHTLTVKPWQVDRMHKKLRNHEYDDILEEYININNEKALELKR